MAPVMKRALTDISGLDGDSAELLEAVGFVDARDVARARPDDLHAEMKKANDLLELLAETPDRKDVGRWVENARKLTGEDGPPPQSEPAPGMETLVAAGTQSDPPPPESGAGTPEPASPDVGETEAAAEEAAAEKPEERMVNFEADPVVAEMLVNAPFAIPVPAAMMAGQKIPVAEVLPGVSLTCARGDIEIRVDTRTRQFSEPSPAENQKAIAEDLVDRGIDVSRIKSIDDVRQHREEKRRELRKNTTVIDELRTPSEKVNRGVDPNSRRFVRGLLHPHRIRLRFAALITLACQVLVILAILASILMLFSTLDPTIFPWVGPWLLVFPVALPVFAILYLLVAAGMKCRVCTQRIFVPRHCLRHVKAHHITPFGYIFALCLHLLLFSWFRCEYCGTAARVKK
jgi:hypothetical protein